MDKMHSGESCMHQPFVEDAKIANLNHCNYCRGLVYTKYLQRLYKHFSLHRCSDSPTFNRKYANRKSINRICIRYLKI